MATGARGLASGGMILPLIVTRLWRTVTDLTIIRRRNLRSSEVSDDRRGHHGVPGLEDDADSTADE
jgi:hypothetical protein